MGMDLVCAERFDEQPGRPDCEAAKEGAMLDVRRFQGVMVLGVQTRLRGDSYVLCVDPETGTTFAVQPGETIGAALERVDVRYRETLKGGHGDGHLVHR